jgi:hypothetical protein
MRGNFERQIVDLRRELETVPGSVTEKLKSMIAVHEAKVRSLEEQLDNELRYVMKRKL